MTMEGRDRRSIRLRGKVRPNSTAGQPPLVSLSLGGAGCAQGRSGQSPSLPGGGGGEELGPRRLWGPGPRGDRLPRPLLSGDRARGPGGHVRLSGHLRCLALEGNAAGRGSRVPSPALGAPPAGHQGGGCPGGAHPGWGQPDPRSHLPRRGHGGGRPRPQTCVAFAGLLPGARFPREHPPQ